MLTRTCSERGRIKRAGKSLIVLFLGDIFEAVDAAIEKSSITNVLRAELLLGTGDLLRDLVVLLLGLLGDGVFIVISDTSP